MWICAAAPIAPPSRPVSAMVVSPRALAASQRLQHVRRLAARRDAERDVARPAERFDLPREHPLEPVVVGDGSSACSCPSSAPSPPARRARARTGRPAPSASAARRRRCRRCRTPAPCRPSAKRRRGSRRAASHDRRRDRRRACRSCSAMRRRRRPPVTDAQHRPSVERRQLQSSSFRARSRVASMFATNSSCETCSGSYVFTGCLICTG